LGGNCACARPTSAAQRRAVAMVILSSTTEAKIQALSWSIELCGIVCAKSGRLVKIGVDDFCQNGTTIPAPRIEQNKSTAFYACDWRSLATVPQTYAASPFINTEFVDASKNFCRHPRRGPRLSSRTEYLSLPITVFWPVMTPIGSNTHWFYLLGR
jgi:hypothetical protein